MIRNFLYACLAMAALNGCQTIADHNEVVSGAVIACPDERPEMCTEQYDPVCATLSSGQRISFPNACHACADGEVINYRAGACESD